MTVGEGLTKLKADVEEGREGLRETWRKKEREGVRGT